MSEEDTDNVIDLSDFVEDKEETPVDYPPPAPVPGGFVQNVGIPATLYLVGDEAATVDLTTWGYGANGVYTESDELDAYIPFTQISMIEFHYPKAEDEGSSS